MVDDKYDGLERRIAYLEYLVEKVQFDLKQHKIVVEGEMKYAEKAARSVSSRIPTKEE